jgi:hypothetical protein
MIPLEIIPGMEGGGIRQKGQGDKFKYDIFNTM